MKLSSLFLSVRISRRISQSASKHLDTSRAQNTEAAKPDAHKSGEKWIIEKNQPQPRFGIGRNHIEGGLPIELG